MLFAPAMAQHSTWQQGVGVRGGGRGLRAVSARSKRCSALQPAGNMYEGLDQGFEGGHSQKVLQTLLLFFSSAPIIPSPLIHCHPPPSLGALLCWFQLTPLHSHTHSTEGFALDWSRVTAGRLVTGEG